MLTTSLHSKLNESTSASKRQCQCCYRRQAKRLRTNLQWKKLISQTRGFVIKPVSTKVLGLNESQYKAGKMASPRPQTDRKHFSDHGTMNGGTQNLHRTEFPYHSSWPWRIPKCPSQYFGVPPCSFTKWGSCVLRSILNKNATTTFSAVIFRPWGSWGPGISGSHLDQVCGDKAWNWAQVEMIGRNKRWRQPGKW